MKLTYVSEPVKDFLGVYVPTKTKVILRGEEINLNGRIRTKSKETFNEFEENFEEILPIYHSLAVLATFLDLPDDPKKNVDYNSEGRHIPEKKKKRESEEDHILRFIEPCNTWSVNVSLPRKHHLDLDEERWFTYTANFEKENDDGENGLPLLKIIRWYGYDDSAEGWTTHTEREYLLQLHVPSENDFLGEDVKRLEEILKRPYIHSAVCSGGRTAYNHTDNKGFYTLEELSKEPEVKDALITLVKTHPSWKDKPLGLFI